MFGNYVRFLEVFIMMIKKMNPVVLYSVVIILFAMVLFFVNTPSHSTSAKIEGKKNIKSVFVCEGDSLWGIADEHYTELNGSMREYMDEIKRTNQLTSDAIHSGTYLLVPYYEINQ